MKRIEKASNGATVTTGGVLVAESNAILVHQTIKDAQGKLETRNLVTLSKSDLYQLCKEYIGLEEPSYCHYCDKAMFDGDAEFLDGEDVCCSHKCVEARQAQR